MYRSTKEIHSNRGAPDFLPSLLQHHLAEAECIEIQKKSIATEARLTLSDIYCRATLERQNVKKYIRNPKEIHSKLKFYCRPGQPTAQPKDAHPNRMLFNFVSLSQPCSRARFERSMDPRTQIGESAICARLNSSIQHPQIGSVTVSHGSSSHAGRRQGTLIRPPQRRPYHPRARVLRHNRLAFWLRRQPRPLQRRSRCQEEGLSAESHATHRMRGWRTQRTRSCHG